MVKIEIEIQGLRKTFILHSLFIMEKRLVKLLQKLIDKGMITPESKVWIDGEPDKLDTIWRDIYKTEI